MKTSRWYGLLLIGAMGCQGGGEVPGLGELDILQRVDGVVPDGAVDDLPGDVSRPDVPVEPDVPLPDGALCRPGQTQCLGSNFMRCKADGSDFEVTPCTGGKACTLEGCQAPTTCSPNVARCNDQGAVEVCLPDGSGYGPATACEDGYTCQGGRCVATICTPGQTECTQTSLLTCQGNPPAWKEEPCGEQQICFRGRCIDCFSDDQCEAPMVCQDGSCTIAPLEILTRDLPDGAIQTDYQASLLAKGGIPPYSWTLESGALPDGLTLGTNGEITGRPTRAGTFAFQVAVHDTQDLMRVQPLDIVIRATSDLAITSKSPLPAAEEGTAYQYQFTAVGGQKPYGWMVTAGSLPAGLGLDSTGLLLGTPAAHGDFDFTVRVVDVGDPIGIDAKPFRLTVKIAPLEIIGDQVINLFLTKAVILPLITIVEGIPIPYRTQLQAKGGVKPYHWTEQQLPSMLATFIPKAGIPQGLTLADDGTLSGSVTDTSLVFELNIPFVNYKLTGFFFMAKVEDSQSPADSDQAIFLIPTIPVNLGGGGGGLPF